MDHKIVAARTEVAQRRIGEAAQRLAGALGVEAVLDLQRVHDRYRENVPMLRLEAIADFLEMLAARGEQTPAVPPVPKPAKRGKEAHD